MSAGRGCFPIVGMVFLFVMAIGVISSIAGAAVARMVPLVFILLLIYFGWKIAIPWLDRLTEASRPKATGSAASVPLEANSKSRDSRIKQIKKAIPANEPIRATLITVVEEAIALRGMADRIANYPFADAGVAQSLHSDELRRKSDDAISLAMDLTGRLQIIYENTKGRPRSQRAAAAMTAQHVRMEHLRDALVYSRDAIEEMVLTHGEAPGATDRIARGLRNLTDAIDESYGDPLDTKIAALT